MVDCSDLVCLTSYFILCRKVLFFVNFQEYRSQMLVLIFMLLALHYISSNEAVLYMEGQLDT